MNEQKYLKIAICCIILIVVSVAGYGTFINEASRQHIEKMKAAQYTVLPVEYAGYRNLHAVMNDVDITAKADWTIDIHAQYEGVLEDVLVKTSQYVKKGDMLAVMSNNDLQAQHASADAEIEQARAMMINYAQIAERYRMLVENNAISIQEYDSAVAQRDAAKAQMESRIAQRDLVQSEVEKLTVTAPQDASIVQVYHERGDYVRPGEALFMLSDIRTLHVHTIIEHWKLKDILDGVGKEFILSVEPHRLTHKAYPLSASNIKSELSVNQFRISMINVIPDIKSSADFHEVIWSVDNTAGILEPTYYNETSITSTETERVLSVPSKAIHFQGSKDKAFLYSLDKDSRLVKKIVKVGIDGGEYSEIEEGIAEGDPVVIASPAEYTEGMKVGVKKNGANIPAKSP